jgi:hypothetical protein
VGAGCELSLGWGAHRGGSHSRMAPVACRAIYIWSSKGLEFVRQLGPRAVASTRRKSLQTSRDKVLAGTPSGMSPPSLSYPLDMA